MKDTIFGNANRKNLLQLFWLRLIAIFGQVITIISAHYFLHIALPLTMMFLVVLSLTIVNFTSFFRYKLQKNISDKSLFIELLFDVAALTTQLYFSGGASNPFISLFLLQVIISAILLRKVYACLITIITIICYIWLSFNHQILHAFHNHDSSNLFNLHLHGMLISYIFSAILLLIFITKITNNLKERDQKINLLTRKSFEKEQIVKMGFLATGAAHELGTPLSTMSVILGDWKNMNLKKDLIEDVELVESQISRCKKILSEILLNSGKERLEKAKAISVKESFDNLVKDWKSSRKVDQLIYNFEGNDDKKIILDDILTQSFFNIFDNALEESPNFVAINAKIENNTIILTVEDRGKGFSDKVLKEIGKPNLTTKNSSGLGLFLAINSLDVIAGDLKITNLAYGAKVTIIIPLQNL